MESSQMLVTTYQSTRCHNKESHNIYLCSWKRLYLLLHPLFSSPFLSFTRAVYCIPLWKDSKQSVLTCFLRPPPHGLNPIAAVWTQFVPSAVHLVPVSESFYTFAYHVIGGVVSASISASAALSCAGLLTTYWSFNIFFFQNPFLIL